MSTEKQIDTELVDNVISLVEEYYKGQYLSSLREYIYNNLSSSDDYNADFTDPNDFVFEDDKVVSYDHLSCTIGALVEQVLDNKSIDCIILLDDKYNGLKELKTKSLLCPFHFAVSYDNKIGVAPVFFDVRPNLNHKNNYVKHYFITDCVLPMIGKKKVLMIITDNLIPSHS